MAEAYQDLLKDTSESKENGNYFLVTITDLIPNTTYPIQFRWVYKDKTTNDSWSSAKLITTPGESEPDTPKFGNESVDVSQPEKIIITWDGTSDNSSAIANYDRVDVYIDGLPFDGAKAAYSFKAPGTAIIPAPAGTYQIVLYAVSKTGTLSPVSSAVTKTVTAIGVPVTDPEDPDTPTIKAGLASVIVSWNGKKTGGGDLTTTGFAGARVYIGTTSTFTPSNDNWVHTLNFANGSNQVSIGVGTVINKSTGATLAYGTPYYIKLGTLNASGATTGNYVVADPTNITVSKLPASEISTGILSADASITAGASSGARVVMSGASSPFIIYGTDGTTKLLEFIGGATGTLSITGSGKFTGDLEIGSSNAIFKAQPSVGIWLGNAAYASAPFSVSNNGIIKAQSGTIGGWALGTTYLQNASSSPTIKIDTTGITVGATTSSYFDITPSSLTHRNSNGTASGKFTLTLGASPQLTIDGNITINGSSAATQSMLASYATTTDLSTGLGTKIGATDVNTNVTSISGGVITTGVIDLDLVNIENAATGARLQISSTGLNAYKLTSAPGVNPPVYTNTVFIGTNGDAFFKGDITGASGTFSGSLSGATITGGVIKTASSGARISLNETTNQINIYPDTTSSPGYISASTVLSAGSLKLASPFATGYAQSNIQLYSLGASTSYVQLNANLTQVVGGLSVTAGSLFSGNAEFVSNIVATGAINATTLTPAPNTYITTDGQIRRTSGSSIRFKRDIVDLLSVVDLDPKKLYDLPVRAFKYKNEFVSDEDSRYNKLLPGFIAEEVEEIYPIAADYDSNGVEKWNANVMVPAMLALIQDLNTRLDALEA
jgi:hypothetical protein